MKRSKIKLAGFTLVEVTVTTVIIAVLIGVLFSIFLTITRLAVKVQLERNVHNEMIYFMQTVQNLVDEGDLSLTGYDVNSLADSYGVEDELLMAGSSYQYTLKESCSSTGANCKMVLERFDPGLIQTKEFVLTDPAKVTIDNFYVKLLPYGSQMEQENVQHQGFWIYMDVSSPQYDADKRWFRVSQKIQTFFNVRQY